jgi:hypothetical protein
VKKYRRKPVPIFNIIDLTFGLADSLLKSLPPVLSKILSPLDIEAIRVRRYFFLIK